MRISSPTPYWTLAAAIMITAAVWRLLAAGYSDQVFFVLAVASLALSAAIILVSRKGR